MIFVYIIQSLVDRGYYIGITKDISKRLKKHNLGQVDSTRNRKPFTLIVTEEFSSYSLARLREKEIKSYKGGVMFKKLIRV